MAVSEIRDVTYQLFPIQSPILMKKDNNVCRIIVDYKNDLFLGFFDLSGGSLEDMLPIQNIYRLVEGGIAIFFYNSHDAPFIHIIQRNENGFLTVVNIQDTEPVKLDEEFMMSSHEEYNKIAHLFQQPQKVERLPTVV